MRTCQTNAEAPECRDFVPCGRPAPHLARDERRDHEWWCCDEHAREHKVEGYDVERDA